MNRYKILATAIVTAGLLIPGAAALGSEFMAPEREGGDNLVLPASEIHKNLYIAGGSVTVDSLTEGDLYIAGGTVIVNGPVTQDLVATGGTIIINSEIGGDARVAGGTLQINSKISGDLLVAGGTVSISSKSSIGSDLTVGAGELHLEAPVIGNLRAAGGNMSFNSEIKGNVWIRGENGVVFGSNSKVGGSTSLRLKKDVVIKDGAQFASEAEITKLSTGKDWNKFWLHGLWVQLLASIFASLIFLWAFPRTARAVVLASRVKTGSNLGFGVLGLIVVPIIVVLSFVILIGYWIGLLFLSLYFAWLVLASITADLMFGAWLLQKLSGGKKETAGKEWKLDWQAAVLGSGVLTLISSIPFVGWAICAALMLISFGAILHLVWDHRGEKLSAVSTQSV